MLQTPKTKSIQTTAPSLPLICAITLPQDPATIEKVRVALDCGIGWIQYRQKGVAKKDIYLEAKALCSLTKSYGAILTINDYVDIALAIGAEGVHIGQDDLPVREVKRIVPNEMIVGVSTHSLREALDAERAGADYIGFGPVFMTDTKDAGQPKGINGTLEISQRIHIPIVAIGGINKENVLELLRANRRIQSVALSSGIFKGNVRQNCTELLNSLKALSEIINRA